MIETLLDSTIHFRVAQFPDMDPKVNDVFFLSLAFVAKVELIFIKARTKVGLAIAKKNEVALGTNGQVLALTNKAAAIAFAKQVQPVIEELLTNGFSIRRIAKELKIRKIKTPQGKTKWHANSVFRLLKLIELIDNMERDMHLNCYVYS